MVPVLAFFVLSRAIEARRDAILSFDPSVARRCFPDEGIVALDPPPWQDWARPVVARALGRYPASSLVARLDGASVVWLLWYDKTYLGGCNDAGRRRIVVALGPGTITEGWLERAVHHELAHVLKDGRGSGFPAKAWRAANAPGFRYASDGYEAIKGGKSNEAFDASLCEKGVLSEYGASSLDEDWATIAESILADDPAFWALTSRYPRLREKARLAVAFYRRSFPGIVLRDAGP